MSGPVVALKFSVADGTVRLMSHQRMEKTVPPSHPVAEYRGRAGTWFEVDDAAGKPLYGRRMFDPLPTHHETFGPDGTAKWLPRSAAVTEFEIRAPLPRGAVSVAVFSSSIAGATAAAREIVRVNLRDIAP